MRIARVFPRKTKFSPTDPDAYFDAPGFFTPEYDEAHVSVVFTWDKPKAEQLARQWKQKAKLVRIGGPAYGDRGGEFTPGLYVKQGVTITSRGCPNFCPFCLVPGREGAIRELEIKPGKIIQDNNLLACSPAHLKRVFAMLRTQKSVCYRGGLEARRITDEIAEEMHTISTREIWLACDTPGALKETINAIVTLRTAGFKNYQLRVYVLIGRDMEEERERLQTLLDFGATPFAQLYQPEKRIRYSQEWRDFARLWSRPAAMRAKNIVLPTGKK